MTSFLFEHFNDSAVPVILMYLNFLLQCSFSVFGNGGGPSELGNPRIRTGNWEKLKHVRQKKS